MRSVFWVVSRATVSQRHIEVLIETKTYVAAIVDVFGLVKRKNDFRLLCSGQTILVYGIRRDTRVIVCIYVTDVKVSARWVIGNREQAAFTNH